MPRCGWRIPEKFPRRSLCPEIFKPPLTCAVVRERPRMFALTLLVAQSTLVLSNFARTGGPREIQSTRENWRTTVTSQSIRSESRGTEHDAIRPAAPGAMRTCRPTLHRAKPLQSSQKPSSRKQTGALLRLDVAGGDDTAPFFDRCI